MEQISRTKAIMVNLIPSEFFCIYLGLINTNSLCSSAQNREPFIVVLLDGNGIIFKDDLLQLGEEGGRKAATELSFAVEDYVTNKFPSIISPKILTKMYVNMKSLCDACVRGGITTDPSILDEFARGFNGSSPLFDLIDVGLGQNAAHDKIKGMQCTCRTRAYPT